MTLPAGSYNTQIAFNSYVSKHHHVRFVDGATGFIYELGTKKLPTQAVIGGTLFKRQVTLGSRKAKPVYKAKGRLLDDVTVQILPRKKAKVSHSMIHPNSILTKY